MEQRTLEEEVVAEVAVSEEEEERDSVISSILEEVVCGAVEGGGEGGAWRGSQESLATSEGGGEGAVPKFANIYQKVLVLSLLLLPGVKLWTKNLIFFPSPKTDIEYFSLCQFFQTCIFFPYYPN